MNTAATFTGISGGLRMSLVAMGVVFIVIAFLMFLMLLLNKICNRAEEQKNAKKADVSANVAETSEEQDESELIAVLAAAVMQYAGSSAKLLSFCPSKVCPPKNSGWRSFAKLQNFETVIKR